MSEDPTQQVPQPGADARLTRSLILGHLYCLPAPARQLVRDVSIAPRNCCTLAPRAGDSTKLATRTAFRRLINYDPLNLVSRVASFVRYSTLHIDFSECQPQNPAKGDVLWRPACANEATDVLWKAKLFLRVRRHGLKERLRFPIPALFTLPTASTQ